MTVRELIDALAKIPPEMEVFSEGCDCVGEAEGIAIFAFRDGPRSRDVLLVKRDQG